MLSINNACPVYSAKDMQAWDAYTIANEPVSSLQLMERAASKCVDWLLHNFPGRQYTVVCGPGNNGGDGLAIARLLSDRDIPTSVFVVNETSKYSIDHLANRQLLQLPIAEITSLETIPHINSNDIVIDALFGTGLKQSLSGVFAKCIEWLNQSGNTIVSIDLPSGLLADGVSVGSIIKANYTLTFQGPKLALLLPSSANFCGELSVLDIQLHPGFKTLQPASKYLVDKVFVEKLLRQPNRFDHKGNNGHALLVAGAAGKFGAAVMSIKAALRSGVGLLTAHVPAHAELIIQTTSPEAMLSLDSNEDKITHIPISGNYTAVGVGPGLGTDLSTIKAIKILFQKLSSKLILDADAINALSVAPELMQSLPTNAVLTPHVKEFERMVGVCKDAFERHQRQLDFSKQHQVYVILKGAYSCLTTPEGIAYFNTTGNPGMAKGGSGDVLTGVMTALLAQKYSPEESAIIGMYVHGLAGDMAAEQFGAVAMNASDIIEKLPEAFKRLEKLPGN